MEPAPATDPVQLLLETARTPAALERTVQLVRGHASPWVLRAALARVARDPAWRNTRPWPTVVAIERLREELDAQLDAQLQGFDDALLVAALSRALAQCERDDERLSRCLAVVHAQWSPPRARAAARFVDVLRAHPLGRARVPVYRYLLSLGVDVRAALESDVELDPPEQLEVLLAWARTRANRRTLTRADWWPDARRTLARALGDWTRHATHPGHLVYAFVQLEGAEGRAWLAGLPERALGGAVWLAVQGALQASEGEYRAVALGAGRHECGRCGDERVLAAGQEGGVLGLRCEGCALRYEARDGEVPRGVARG